MKIWLDFWCAIEIVISIIIIMIAKQLYVMGYGTFWRHIIVKLKWVQKDGQWILCRGKIPYYP